MPYYGVMLRGSDVWLRIVEPRWFGLRQRVFEGRHGFYTTRYFEAASPEEAEQRAVELVRDEVRAVYANRAGEPFQIFVEEISEYDVPPGHLPGGGFTWFAEGEGEGDTRPPADTGATQRGRCSAP